MNINVISFSNENNFENVKESDNEHESSDIQIGWRSHHQLQ